MFRNRLSGRAVVALAAVLALTVAASVSCRDEEQDPLIVGNLNTFTGSLSEFGPPLRNAVELASSHVNRAGGVGGAPMLIVSRDTAVNPVQGVDAARALVDVENVVAIVGALSSGVTLAVANAVTIPKQILMVSGASTRPASPCWKTTTSSSALLPRMPPKALCWPVSRRNRATSALASCISTTPTARDWPTSRGELYGLGGTVTARSPHEDVQPTYVSELERATEGDPDVLAVLSYTGQASVYVREAMEGGYADAFLFADGTKGSEWIDGIDAWEALDGSLGTVQGSADSPAKGAFESAYLEEFGFEPSHPFMAEHYDATVLIALAAAKAGSTTDSAAIRDAIRDVANAPGEVVGPGRDEIAKALALIADGEDINYNGAGGDVEFDEHGDVFGTIEIWEIAGGEIRSTGRFETP